MTAGCGIMPWRRNRTIGEMAGDRAMGSGMTAHRTGGTTERTARGLAAYATGHAAEIRVAETYEDRGCTVLHRCWRSAAGEVDLVLQDQGQLVFVEVKRAESHDAAAYRLSRRQMDRICRAALLYVEDMPMGALTDLRFDAALVDAAGCVQIIENAFGDN